MTGYVISQFHIVVIYDEFYICTEVNKLRSTLWNNFFTVLITYSNSGKE